jgi:hypothetical protein
MRCSRAVDARPVTRLTRGWNNICHPLNHRSTHRPIRRTLGPPEQRNRVPIVRTTILKLATAFRLSDRPIAQSPGLTLHFYAVSGALRESNSDEVQSILTRFPGTITVVVRCRSASHSKLTGLVKGFTAAETFRLKSGSLFVSFF